ncbi:MAG TPA: PIN domain-containing protein [Chloroflexota bacterium]|nr:PIN domain-containing protein [Chloroflexota bacterium]
MGYKRDSRMAAYARYLHGRRLFVSFQTVAELDRWMLARVWGEPRRAALEAYLVDFVTAYADRNMCRLWAQVMDNARRQGRPIAVGDAWVAATALLFGLPLVTHNHRHYAGVDGLVVVSES